ncbi:MAG TPA: TolC family protein [Kofleriaceae bacterium]|nr:TolC family protein [Kofleriaceae bacterium]
MLFALILALPAVAHADLWTRAVPDTAGGGGSAAAPADDADLIAWAGEPQAISLGELLQLAVRQAPSLQSAKIDIAVAEAQISETFARHDWTVAAQATGSETHGFFSGLTYTSRAYGLTADVSRVLPTGGTVDLHVSSQYQKSESTMFGSSKDWLDTVSGSITQPLLKGRGAELYDAQERKLSLVRDSAVLARRLAAINTMQTVISAYWDLVLAERQVAITRASLDLAHERLRVTQIGAQGGKIAQAEIPAVEQIIATREEDVLNGELGVLNASIALRRTVGLPIGPGDLGLRVPTDLDTKDRGWQMQALLERAYAASPELAQLAKQDQSSSIDIDVAENGLLPQLDAALSLGPVGQSPNFSDAASDLVHVKELQANGSLTFSRSLHQYDVRGRVKELRTAREKIRVNQFDIRAQYAQGIARAVAGIELAKRRVVLSQRAIDLANENIRIETDRFNLGKSTNFDVLNRLEELRQAELRKAQAMIDWHKSEAVVEALTGDILPDYGVTLD